MLNYCPKILGSGCSTAVGQKISGSNQAMSLCLVSLVHYYNLKMWSRVQEKVKIEKKREKLQIFFFLHFLVTLQRLSLGNNYSSNLKTCLLAVKNLSSLISAKVAQKLSFVILKRFEGKEGVVAEWSKALLSGAKEKGKNEGPGFLSRHL